MEQKSNVQFRAKKEYKNRREKFDLLLREIISNSIHAVLIRQKKEDGFIPELSLDIIYKEDQCKIKLRDNGEGFTENNRRYFEELDSINKEKEEFNFHPLGQGRLAIIFFTDTALYDTVYRDKDGVFRKRSIPYPNTDQGLFSFDNFAEEGSSATDSYTQLSLAIHKQHTFGRAKTFFKKYPDTDTLKGWFIETFFPFIVTNDHLNISITLNGETKSIHKNSIEEEIESIPFEISFRDEKKYQFKLWLIQKKEELHGENTITCFARDLRAELVDGKLSYSIDNSEGHLFYLTSDYFDENVDSKGEKIEIPNESVIEINKKINEVLDNKYRKVIENNQKETKRQIINFRKKYPSLETFVDRNSFIGGKNIVKEDDLVKTAIDEKSRIEKKFWTHIDNDDNFQNEDTFDESEECQKLLNSSLHIYVKHRESILKKLKNLVKEYDNEGSPKPELESTIHELFLRKGTTLSSSNNINHLHNLWILDDKYTIFSNDFKAWSTKPGQSLSDIYIWADNPEKTKEILILELKSTTKAHNAGKHKEGMIAQVKRYAQDFYKNPSGSLNWDVETNHVQYLGVILARKTDIVKELKSNNVSGYYRIPFLSNSYYGDDSFVKPESLDPMDKINIRIELYSYEDIYLLASSRNDVFFRLLKNEFEIETDEKAIEV